MNKGVDNDPLLCYYIVTIKEGKQMSILKFALLMGLVGFIGSFLPINFSWIFFGVIVASAINGAKVESSKGTEES